MKLFDFFKNFCITIKLYPKISKWNRIKFETTIRIANQVCAGARYLPYVRDSLLLSCSNIKEWIIRSNRRVLRFCVYLRMLGYLINLFWCFYRIMTWNLVCYSFETSQDKFILKNGWWSADYNNRNRDGCSTSESKILRFKRSIWTLVERFTLAATKFQQIMVDCSIIFIV